MRTVNREKLKKRVAGSTSTMKRVEPDLILQRGSTRLVMYNNGRVEIINKRLNRRIVFNAKRVLAYLCAVARSKLSYLETIRALTPYSYGTVAGEVLSIFINILLTLIRYVEDPNVVDWRKDVLSEFALLGAVKFDDRHHVIIVDAYVFGRQAIREIEVESGMRDNKACSKARKA